MPCNTRNTNKYRKAIQVAQSVSGELKKLMHHGWDARHTTVAISVGGVINKELISGSIPLLLIMLNVLNN